MDSQNGNGTAGTPVPGPLLFTVGEVAQRLRISVATVWRLRDAGKLPMPVKFGRNVRWRASDIEEWIRDRCPELAPSR